MLINAMEVTGIEGTYRCTCESTMDVLRRNKDSLMAVLEAFVYDPLLNWRLIDNKPKSKKSKTHGEVRLKSLSTFFTTIFIFKGWLVCCFQGRFNPLNWEQ